MAKIFVEAYGCSASFADSEMISGLIQNGGHTLVDDSSNSDLNIVVTCSVKDATANKMIHRIKSLKSKPLVVAGCLPKAEKETVEKFSESSNAICFLPLNVESITCSVFPSELGPSKLAFSENFSTVSFSAFGRQPATTSGFDFNDFIL